MTRLFAAPADFARLLLSFCLVAGFATSALQAQTRITSTVPSPAYFSCFEPFYEGDYKTAQASFKDVGQGGIKTTDGQWIDSICYHAMSGECFYHTGRLAQALDQYELALKLAIAHNGWLLQVQFPEAINASQSSARARINWATSSRRTALGSFPGSMSVFQGRLNNDNVVRMGGVIQPPSLYPVCVQEVVRCTALALRRRKELLGPIGAQDPLTASLIQTFSQRSAPANHWSQSWISVQLGLAYAMAGRNAQATAELQGSLLASGQFDHPLTATALLELGKLALDQGNYQVAGGLFMEATLAAGQFGEADIVEEGMRLALTCHLASNQPGVFAPLSACVPWAKSNDFRHLQTSLSVLLAENLATIGQTPGATAALGEAQRLLGRRELQGSDVAARASYVTALITYQAGQISAGDAALVLSMGFFKTGSKRIFQIGLVDRLFLAGVLTPRIANDLFADVLRDPTPADWVHEPMETLAVSLTPHPLPIEHWFEIAVERKEIDRALEIADLARRHKFYSLLPMGGRLLSLQWLLGAPEEMLGDAGKLQKQALLARYPKIAELNTQVKALQLQLTGEPLVVEGEKAKEHEASLAQLARLAATEEGLLRELALRRDPSSYVFPPMRKTADVQKALAPGQLCLVFFNTSLATNVFVLNREKYNHWRLDSPAKVGKDLANMLREIGQYDRNQPLTTAQFRDTKWKATSTEIFKLIFKKGPEVLESYDELIVVPDGAFWYIPFEALQVGKAGASTPLLNKMRVRYSPTLSLILPDSRPARPLGHTAVVTGKLLPKEPEELSQENLAALKEVLPGVVPVTSALPAASGLMAKLCQRLIVLAEIDDNVRGPLDWSPMVVDRGKPGGAIAAWLMLPWGGPEQVLLPGYHSAAEYGLKKGGVGDELFIPAMTLMATGTRTVLLSRWRVGGQTCQDLVREFAQELPHTSAAAAWQRSVQLAWQAEIDFDREPRLTHAANDDAIKADHPFLWAGYMVIDTGFVPKKDEPKPK